MTSYESELKVIASSEISIFAKLSDLNNLELVKDKLVQESKIQDLQFDTDSCSFVVDGFGKMGFKVVERIPSKTIKINSVGTPFSVEIELNLNQIADNETEMKLVLNADIPMMIKMMVDKKLKEGINKIADLMVKTLGKSA